MENVVDGYRYHGGSLNKSYFLVIKTGFRH